MTAPTGGSLAPPTRSGPAITMLRGAAVAVGLLLGLAGVFGGRGWVWPLLLLAGAVAIGVLVGRQPTLVAVLMVVTGALLAAPDPAVGYLGAVWMWATALVAATVLVRSVRRCVPDGPTVLWHLALLLPAAERASWRAEVRSVLHACASDAEARRQVFGFLAAVPATIVTSWRVRR